MNKEKKSTYDIKYAKKNIVQKKINFNRQNSNDIKLLKWWETHENAQQWIKELIEKDMNNRG